MLEGIASDSGTVVVENNIGTASITDAHHRILVPDCDEAPIVDQAASQDVSAGSAPLPDAPEGGDVEVSAGGEEGAFPGDPIVVSGDPEVFDLAPGAAPLPAPPFSAILLQGSSVWRGPGHHSEEVILQGQLGPVASTDGTAPKTLTGWEPLKRVWEISGSAAVSGEAPELPYEHKSSPIKPTEQNSMAGLALAPEQRPTGELELFFNLQYGSLARFTANPIEGSATRTKLALSAGAELSFDFFFDAGDQSPRNDCALFVIGDHAFKLSDVAATGKRRGDRLAYLRLYGSEKWCFHGRLRGSERPSGG
jgi:hypothetical protein